MTLTKSSIFGNKKRVNDNSFNSLNQNYVELQRNDLDNPFTLIVLSNKNSYTYEIRYNNKVLVKETRLPEVMYRNSDNTFSLELIIGAYNEVLKSFHNDKEYKQVEAALAKIFREEGSNYYQYGVFDEMALYHFIVANIGRNNLEEVLEDTNFLNFILPTKPQTIKDLEVHYLSNMFNLHN